MSFANVFEAAREGAVEEVRLFIEQGVDVNAKAANGFAPLHEAAINRRIEVAKILISAGADVNMQTIHGETAPARTPLHMAVFNGDVEFVKTLISAGADINAKNNPGITPLHVAALRGNIEVAKILLSKGADVNAMDKDGNTPLAVANMSKHDHMVQYLKEIGGNMSFSSIIQAAEKGTVENVRFFVEQKGVEASTKNVALFIATTFGNTEIVKYLISAGADINAKGFNSLTPIQLAAMNGNVEIAKALISVGANTSVCDDKNGHTLLHLAAINGCAEITQFLISVGANISAKDNFGSQPLHCCKNAETAEILLSSGADIKAKNNFGYSPLHTTAMRDGCIKVTEFLLSKGADVNAKDDGSVMPLHYAAMYGLTETAKILISAGADINANDGGGTPLWCAVFSWCDERVEMTKCVEIIKYLISLGADVNLKNNEGYAPLHHAVSEGNIEATKLLISSGADVNVKNINLLGTPLHYAAAKGYIEIAKILISAGADVNASDKDGCTPLSINPIIRSLEEAGRNTHGITRKPEQLKSIEQAKSAAPGCGCNMVDAFVLILVIAIVAFVIYYCSSGDTNDDKVASAPQEESIAASQSKPIKSVQIGNQTWMAENLNDVSKGGKCHDDNPSNCEKYGRLYTWEEAKKACPEGWHLPSDAEWTTLIKFAGGDKTAGRKLKAKNGWSNNGNGTDDYGFSLTGDGEYSRLWSSTEHNANNAWRRRLDHDRGNVLRDNQPKIHPYSVRCVQNLP